MKYLIGVLLLLFTQTTTGQLTENKIRAYSELLSHRNAILLKCDTLSHMLEIIYTGLLTKVARYDGKKTGATHSIRLAAREVYKRIKRLLQGKPKRLFRKLYRETGNVFLVSQTISLPF